MCGIAGFYNDHTDRAGIIRRMTDRMVHRGPDAEGFWIDERSPWTFGHRRLAIIDLSPNGAQPMVSRSGRFVITYNGEIYNMSDVRDRLLERAPGLTLRGTSDTEVLLESIEAFGIADTLTLCRGMFAFAVYDRESGVLCLARDRAGEKPLYYGLVETEENRPYFAFASDISLFTELPGFKNEIDTEALSEMILHSYIPAPMSIYRGIYKLTPGTLLTLAAPYDEWKIEPYWSMTGAALDGRKDLFAGSEQEASDELERLLKDSIRGQMISDVPLGAFLSGGIDSATVVSLMQDMSDRRVKTFTIGFDDPKYNEAEYARAISEHLGTDHTDMIISESEMKQVIPDMARYFTEPFGDSSMIPTYFVSRLAREHVTVSLSGDAGDELFCGYEGYWKCAAFADRIGRIPPAVRNLAAAVVTPFDRPSASKIHRIKGTLRARNICQLKDVVFDRKNVAFEKIVTGAAAESTDSIGSLLDDPVADMELFDMLRYHPDDILVKVDRAGMAVSLENRVPMLDRDVMEFAWRIPTEYKFSDGVSKRVLRNILYKYVPGELMERPKQGFSVPLDKWLAEGETARLADDLIYGSTLAKDGIIDGALAAYCRRRMSADTNLTRLVWNILMAEQWYRGYVISRSRIPG